MTQAILQKTAKVTPTHELHNPPKPEPKAPPTSLLTAALEGFSDGLLILSPDGECLHSNQRGHQLCHQLRHECDLSIVTHSPQPPEIPAAIWQICEYLVESRDLFPDQELVISKSVTCPQGCSIRIRVQWIELTQRPETCLLVTLEDETQAARVSAMLEAHHFRLTERETDVWMLKRADHTYDEIAAKLFITTNTVKRHLKSIYAKRKQMLDEEE